MNTPSPHQPFANLQPGQPQPPVKDLLFAELADKEKEYQLVLNSGGLFWELKELKKAIGELRGKLENCS
jgi:hypothetical protein